jgi:hypothetical protein
MIESSLINRSLFLSKVSFIRRCTLNISFQSCYNVRIRGKLETLNSSPLFLGSQNPNDLDCLKNMFSVGFHSSVLLFILQISIDITRQYRMLIYGTYDDPLYQEVDERMHYRYMFNGLDSKT